jgi:putative FmdB family regulatory protein
MPTYEYRCPEGHQFEKFQRMSEPPVAQCPACGKEAERMLSGGAGLLFKGEGFYITDNRSESYKKAASKEASGGSPKEGGSGGGKSGSDPGSGGGSGGGKSGSEPGSSGGSGGPGAKGRE